MIRDNQLQSQLLSPAAHPFISTRSLRFTTTLPDQLLGKKAIKQMPFFFPSSGLLYLSTTMAN
jgi:hypothetical protein